MATVVLKINDVMIELRDKTLFEPMLNELIRRNKKLLVEQKLKKQLETLEGRRKIDFIKQKILEYLLQRKECRAKEIIQLNKEYCSEELIRRALYSLCEENVIYRKSHGVYAVKV